MNSITVNLNISADEYLKSYQHHQAVVFAMTEDGRRVKFPASLLKRFVMHDGIRGRFCIEFDTTGKCQAIRKL